MKITNKNKKRTRMGQTPVIWAPVSVSPKLVACEYA